jgi:hypothetical protein
VKEFALLQSPLDFTWLTDEEIHWEGSGRCHTNLEGLVVLIPAGHDHQDIYVAVGVRRAVSVGAEQNDLVRMEVLGQLTGPPTDNPHGNIATAI